MFSPYAVRIGDDFDYFDIRNISDFRIYPVKRICVFWFRCCDPIVIRTCSAYEFDKLINRLEFSWNQLLEEQESTQWAN